MTLTEDDLKNTFGISSLGLRRRVMTRLSELLDMSRPRAKLMSRSSSIGYGFDQPVPPASALRTASEPPGVSLQTTTPAPAQSSQMQRPQRVPSPQKRGKLETDKLEQHAINVMDAKHEQKDVILKTTAVSEAVPDKPITFQRGARQGQSCAKCSFWAEDSKKTRTTIAFISDSCQTTAEQIIPHRSYHIGNLKAANTPAEYVECGKEFTAFDYAIVFTLFVIC